MNEETLQIGMRLHDFLKRNAPGLKRAIPREVVLKHLQCLFPGLDDRQFRVIYTAHFPVGRCDAGLYYPMNNDDIQACEEYLMKKIPGTMQSVKRLKEYYPGLSKDKSTQGKLF